VAWEIFGCSVRGAAHERTGLPNQDAIAWSRPAAEGFPVILAVSDGHGSPKCFRSEVGSRLAVEAALAVLAELFGGDAKGSPSAAKRIAESSLGRTISRRWGESVDRDLADRPFRPEEIESLAQQHGDSAWAAVATNPRLAYGATLLAALIEPTVALFFQLGDGDILTVSQDGTVTRPLGVDPRLFANETTSLCGPEAWQDVRVALSVLDDAGPALVVLSTDGYPNSFASDDDFTRAGADLLAALRQDGLESVSAVLPDWLADATAQGSGDDVTVGFLYRADSNQPSPLTEA
jgi:hypothetical protein